MESQLGKYVLGLLVGISIGLNAGNLIHSRNHLAIPRINSEKVELGCVSTDDLEARSEDLNQNGKKEIIMKIKNIDYIFRYDSTGYPVLSRYELRPSQIEYLDSKTMQIENTQNWR